MEYQRYDRGTYKSENLKKKILPQLGIKSLHREAPTYKSHVQRQPDSEQSFVDYTNACPCRTRDLWRPMDLSL